jgi:hypothetical protein
MTDFKICQNTSEKKITTYRSYNCYYIKINTYQKTWGKVRILEPCFGTLWIKEPILRARAGTVPPWGSDHPLAMFGCHGQTATLMAKKDRGTNGLNDDKWTGTWSLSPMDKQLPWYSYTGLNGTNAGQATQTSADTLKKRLESLVHCEAFWDLHFNCPFLSES